MPGRGAMLTINEAKSEMASLTNSENPAGAGDPTGEYSPIGGVGRKGSDAYGALSDPSWTRIDAQLVGQGGNATKGEMGVGYGVGRTFGGGGSRRRQD